MNCIILLHIVKQSARRAGTVLPALLIILSAFGQPDLTGYNDVAKQRLLIRITAHYLHTVSQGQIDMDSAVRIPSRLYGLSLLLPYNEGYSDGKPSVGTSLLDSGKVKEARALLSNLKEEARMRLLIELGTYFVFKPGTAKSDLDEASAYLKEATALSKTQSTKWKIETLTLQAHLLDQSGRSDESQKIFADVIMLCEQSGNNLAAAQALLSSGRLYYYGHPSRLSNYEKALSIFQTLQAKEKEIETLSEMNVEYFVTKRHDVTEQLSLRILDLEKKIEFHHLQYVYDVLAYLNSKNGNLTAALNFSNKSLESVTSKADSVFASLLYQRRADLLYNLEKIDESLAWLDIAMKDKSKETRLYWYRAFLSKLKVLSNRGREEEAFLLIRDVGSKFPPITDFEKMYFAMSLGQIYEQQKKFGPAEDQYKEFLKLAETFPNEYINGEFPDAFYQISALYRIVGKTGKSREVLERAKLSSFEHGLIGKSNYYYYLFKIDSIEKRYFEAIRDLQLSEEFLDSAFSEDQRKKADELLVKYEADKKDRDIKLLNNQNQLQHIRVQEANRTKNISLAGGASLLIIIGLLFNRYIIKQRSNRKLEANQKELDQKNFFLETLNAEQDKLLKEKEWLIKEVHHRVKNNLQMVTSLLNSQSAYLENDAAVLAVKDSLRRMQAMSLIHQKLYQDENTSTIAMPEYINELVRYLHDSFETGNRIIFESAVEPINLDVSQAIPLGLIINESIVNAIKHAFLNEQKGLVRINLRHDGPDHLLLKISDNGIGMPAGIDVREHNSLGLDLMQGLAKQLNGRLDIENIQGVHIMFRFLILNR